MRKLLWSSTPRKVITIVVALLVVAGIASSGAEDEPAPTADAVTATTGSAAETTAATEPADTAPEPSTTEAPATTAATTTAAPTTTVASTTTAAPTATTLPVIDPGTYIVGAEVAPGAYRVAGYWARLDASGDIIDNDLISHGLGLVVIQDGDAFIEFSGEAIAVAEVPSLDPILGGFEGGTYLVGPDVAPGTYRVNATDGMAYAARLDATLDIIDNDLNEGSVIIVVQASDYALTFNGGTLEKIG